MKANYTKYIFPALLAVAGIYFIVRPKGAKAANTGDGAGEIPDKVTGTNTGKVIIPEPKKTEITGKEGIYVVNTASSSLNIRQLPTTNAKVIGTLAKGTEVFARPSVLAPGWHELIDKISGTFPKITGYVSSKYMAKKF